MFFTSIYFLADMPKAKTEQSDFTISWAKILLTPTESKTQHINLMFQINIERSRVTPYF